MLSKSMKKTIGKAAKATLDAQKKSGGRGGKGGAAAKAAEKAVSSGKPLSTSQISKASRGKGGAGTLAPKDLAKAVRAMEMQGMKKMAGGGSLKAKIDGKAVRGKTKGRYC